MRFTFGETTYSEITKTSPTPAKKPVNVRVTMLLEVNP